MKIFRMGNNLRDNEIMQLKDNIKDSYKFFSIIKFNDFDI